MNSYVFNSYIFYANKYADKLDTFQARARSKPKQSSQIMILVGSGDGSTFGLALIASYLLTLKLKTFHMLRMSYEQHSKEHTVYIPKGPTPHVT